MFLIPTPKQIILDDGSFLISPDTRIVLHSSCDFSDLESARLLQEEISSRAGFKIAIAKAFSKEDNCIYILRSGKKAEEYELKINGSSIEIAGGDSAGIFYGVQTLKQIIIQKGTELPALNIIDAPYFPNRGFYHDVTRGKVPTLNTLKELVDRLSSYKVNQLQLYIEHTFAFKNMTEVWIGKDPLTAEEILELDDYCKKRHVELVPSLSTFGHLYEVLSTKSFGHLCELEDSTGKPYSWVDRMRHHTLDVSNPDSIRLIEKMVEEFVPLFTSDKFNIGCDETFDLGKGKNAKLADEIGTGRLYIDFLNKVINVVKKYDKKIMFWGDIILKHPELLGDIPKDVTCLNWFYGANPNEEDTKTIAESGMQQYVCPGTNSWNRFISAMDEAYTNIVKMTSFGKKYGAVGILNTDWGDFGHINLLASSVPGMIFGASLSWNPDGEKEFSKVDEAVSMIEYCDKSKSLVGLLRSLHKAERIVWWHVSMWKEAKMLKEPELDKWFDVFRNIKIEEIVSGYKKSIELGRELIKLSTDIPDERKLDMEEFIVSSKGVTLLNALFTVIKKHDLSQENVELLEEPGKLAERLELWFDDYTRVWRKRNKESELYRIKENIIYFCIFLRKCR